MDRHVIIKNFWNVGFNGDKSLAKEDLGWSNSVKRDAQSDHPESIFRYVVEMRVLTFCFIGLKTGTSTPSKQKKNPIEVRRLYPNPNWDGRCEYLKSGIEGSPHTSSAGEVLATFREPTELWSNLRIDNTPIGEVLNESVITDLD